MSNAICDFCDACFCSSAPFQEGTKAGVAFTIAKRLVIGLIVTTALAAGVYFAKMAIYSSFDWAIATKMGFSIATSCIIGLMCLAGTAGAVSAAKEKWPSNEDLKV